MERQIIKGRPDFINKNFGKTTAKKFPPYVYSNNVNGCLIHRIKAVEMRWYEVTNRGHDLIRLDSPNISIQTKCGQMFFARKKTTQVCQLPSPDALLCGRCEGKSATFRKNGSYDERRKAHDKLGCAIEIE